MESTIAILIADLSGYTALTETHGAIAAANLIEKYTKIVTNSLVGDSVLHQTTGDEVLIVSSSADQLAATAILMMQHAGGEENFLQVHGGMHYGKILHRNNNYFGTTINLASRIAGKATPGKFWCSAEYMNALADKSLLGFEAKGLHEFKNLSGKKELFEVKIDITKPFHVDPVCRMVIYNTTKALAHPEESVYFCSEHCFQKYAGKR